MKDPQHTGNGFYDINDVESCVRAIREDASMRLFNSIQVRAGKQDATAQVERDLHTAILMRHMYIRPFQNVKGLVQFILDYKPKNDSQECMKSIMLNRLPDLQNAP